MAAHEVECFAAVAVFASAWLTSDSTSSTVPLPALWRLGLAFDWMQIATLGVFFFAGTLLRLFLVPRSALVMAMLFVACALAPPGAPTTLAVWAALPYATILVASNAPHFMRFRGPDYSYGIYVYAYPLQQLVVHYAYDLGWLASLLMGRGQPLRQQ